MTNNRELIIREALAAVREIAEAGKAGEPLASLPKDVESNWGWLQTMWPVVVGVDTALAAVPDAATERERAELWRSLDWMLWGVGMNDVFREPLADKMIAALSDAEFDQAQDLIRGWDVRRGGPHERNLFVEIKAERDAALAAVERVRALAEAWRYGVPEYTSSTYQEGQKDQQRKLVRQLLAALDGAPEPEEKK